MARDHALALALEVPHWHRMIHGPGHWPGHGHAGVRVAGAARWGPAGVPGPGAGGVPGIRVPGPAHTNAVTVTVTVAEVL